MRCAPYDLSVHFHTLAESFREREPASPGAVKTSYQTWIAGKGKDMRRLWILGTVVVTGVVLIASAAAADESIPPHPHLLLIDADIEFDPVEEELIVNSVGGCVDIANNQTLRLNAHHEHFHFGTAGNALRGLTGNFPFPTAPFPGVPWTDCESFLETFGLED